MIEIQSMEKTEALLPTELPKLMNRHLTMGRLISSSSSSVVLDLAVAVTLLCSSSYCVDPLP